MGASVPLSKESAISNTLPVFSAGNGSNIVQQLDQHCVFSFPWILSITHVFFILHTPRAPYLLCRGTLGEGRGKVHPSAPSRDKGPVSISWVTCFSELEVEFRLSFPLHRLKAGLSLTLGQYAIPCINLPLTFQETVLPILLLLYHSYFFEEF